jgi:uncharacterized protein YodC (DUF2158 family)
MAEQKFKDGDAVRLKTGGPKMTVSHYDKMLGLYYCQWFVGTELKDGKFKETSLEPAGDDPDPRYGAKPLHRA